MYPRVDRDHYVFVRFVHRLLLFSFGFFIITKGIFIEILNTARPHGLYSMMSWEKVSHCKLAIVTLSLEPSTFHS